jgi:hypothetical protein
MGMDVCVFSKSPIPFIYGKNWKALRLALYSWVKTAPIRAAVSLANGYILNHIEGLDTPFNLFRTLKNIYGSRLKCEAGYMGFDNSGVYRKIHPIASGDKPLNKEASSIDSLQ